MMRGFRSLVLLMSPALVAGLAATLMTGCASEPVKKPAPPVVIIPASPEEASNIQLDFSKLDPKIRIGHVSISDGSSMAVVAGIPVDEVKKGSSIQFMDSRQMGIANGTVFTIDKTTDPANPYLIVEFSPTSPGRAPVKGDLAFFDPR